MKWLCISYIVLDLAYSVSESAIVSPLYIKGLQTKYQIDKNLH